MAVPGAWRWAPTHRVAGQIDGADVEIEVMALDLGVEHAGPGRYGFFTAEEWVRAEPPAWEMDVEGRVWFRGQRPLGPVTVEPLVPEE